MSESDISDIFTRAFSLPAKERARLAHALIDSLTGEQKRTVPRADISSLRGLLASGGTPPTDEEVKQMIHDHRMEKYGK